MRLLTAIIITVLYFSANSVLPLSLCKNQVFHTKASMKKIYNKIRFKNKSCTYSSLTYLKYADRALVAKRPSESLWSANHGLLLLKKKSKQKNLSIKLRLAKSSALIALRRSEEAIATLKPLAFSANNSFTATAHRLLIYAYYIKHKKVDVNVSFLYRKFKDSYPRSSFLKPLSVWYKKNK